MVKDAAERYGILLSHVHYGGVQYQDLLVWKRAMPLAEMVYRLTRLLPADERFGLVTQIRRSARSVPANIAEGYGRGKTGEYLMFPAYSIGSAFELQTDLDLVVRLGLLSQEQVRPVATSVLEVAKMLVSLRRSVRQ
jgi:four helix bundle protein